MSFITYINNTISDTSMPKIARDPAARAGTLILFDFMSAFCNPNEDGDLVNEDIFRNMVFGGQNAVVSAGSQKLVNERTTTGGIRAPGSSSNGQAIDFGNGHVIPDGHSFVALAWVKIPAAGYAENNNQRIFSLAGGSGNYLFNIDTGSDNLTPRVTANSQSSIPVHSTVTGFTHDEVHQIGVAWSPGVYYVILDGEVVSQRSDPNTSLIDLSASSAIALTARQSTTLYRLLLEDVTVSGRSFLDAVSSDFEVGSGRGFDE